MYTDFLRQPTKLGPDIESGPVPIMAPPTLVEPPNLIGGGGAPGLSEGSVNALSGLAKSAGQFMHQRADHNAAKKVYDSPMPAKRPPFQTLGPPSIEAA